MLPQLTPIAAGPQARAPSLPCFVTDPTCCPTHLPCPFARSLGLYWREYKATSELRLTQEDLEATQRRLETAREEIATLQAVQSLPLTLTLVGSSVFPECLV